MFYYNYCVFLIIDLMASVRVLQNAVCHTLIDDMIDDMIDIT